MPPNPPKVVVVTPPEHETAERDDDGEPRNPNFVYQDEYDRMKPIVDAINASHPERLPDRFRNYTDGSLSPREVRL